MSIINNSHAIGVDTRNLVLKTRGTLHVKVGDRYYEIDFRNLSKTEEDESEREEFIIAIDSKDLIDNLEYPGDNKLIVGLDGSLFVTKNKVFVDVTPKSTIVQSQTTIAPEIIEKQITSLDSVMINHMLYGSNSLLLDFVNSEVTTDVLTVNREVKLPSNWVKNKCCQTYVDINEDGSNAVDENGDIIVHKKYMDMDFIEIVEIPKYIVVKSGVMIKSNVDAIIPIHIGNDAYTENSVFENGGLYIIYLNNNQVIQTKLT